MVMRTSKALHSVTASLRGAKGFSLIELLVVCLTAGLLGMAILGVYES